MGKLFGGREAKAKEKVLDQRMVEASVPQFIMIIFPLVATSWLDIVGMATIVL